MRRLTATDDAVAEALAVLRAGGLVAHATETCYGLACDVRNVRAVERLFLVKRRPLDQPVSALFSSVAEAKNYVEWNEEAEKLAVGHLPGPLTLILPLKTDAPERLYPTPNGGAAIGVRVSSLPLALSLVRLFGSPVSTTSANLHGLPNPYAPEEIERQFAGAAYTPDLLLDSGHLPETAPSTVIDLLEARKKTVRRQGSIPA